MKTLSVAGVALMCLGLSPFHNEDPVAMGTRAFDQGEYHRAVSQWVKGARLGDSDAQFHLARAYRLGMGLPRDAAKAEKWYRRAAQLGHSGAAAALGLLLVDENRPSEALEWLSRAALRRDPRAEYVLGAMLFKGIGVSKNRSLGYSLMLRASRAGLAAASDMVVRIEPGLSPAEALAGRAGADGARIDASVDKPYRPAALSAALARAPEWQEPDAATPPRQTDAPSAIGSVVVTAVDDERPARRVASRPGKEVLAPARGSASASEWRVQLGAFRDAGNARARWREVGVRFAGQPVHYIMREGLLLVHAGSYTSRRKAQAACEALRSCMPVPLWVARPAPWPPRPALVASARRYRARA